MGTGGAGGTVQGEDLAALDHAITTLESQRQVLGDAVVDTALLPLQARRTMLTQQARGEQRRLVTVVFADLVGFTEMSTWIDPEDTRSIVDTYFSRWLAVIEEHGGEVEKFIGDAVMAVFGVAQSWEDDAQRAVRAALAMVAGLGELNRGLQERWGVSVRMRVGVDTGEVVVSTLGDRDGEPFVVVGPTVNRAARLQAAAPVDGVLISGDTHRQVRGRFSMQRLEPLSLKGIDEPVAAFRVVSERPHTFRLDLTRGVEGISTTTVGRDVEVRFLQERFHDVAEESAWRIVTVVGDAGVGKSRLLVDFDSWLAERPEPVWWFRGRAAQAGRNHANALLRDLVAGRFGISESDSPTEVRTALEQGFASATDDRVDAVRTAHLVGSWLRFDLGLEVGSDPGSVPPDPQTLRDRAGEALAEYLRRLSARAPVVVLLEDLHWADDASLRWLESADAVLTDSPVLVVATTRPALLEDRPRWGEGRDHHRRLALGPLSRRESRQLLAQILHRVDHPPDTLLDVVIDSAEGNPFYLEELVTWLIEAGVIVKDEPRWRVEGDLVGAMVVPSTLRGVLQARLDSLTADQRRLLQRASVVGRVFWDEALDHLTDGGSVPTSAPGTIECLEQLRSRDLVFQREGSTFDLAREFVFKHALLRDVAYDSVLRSHRQRYHAQAATWLTEASARTGRQDEYAALIAEHLDRAHDRRAGEWHLRAGRQAASVYALAEATQLLGRALDLVTDDPVLRFDLLAEREQVLDRVGDRRGQEADLAEMAELAERVGDPARDTKMRLARAALSFVLSDYDAAEVWAEGAAEIAAGAGLAAAEAEALLWQGKSLTWHDEVDSARAQLTEALARAREVSRPLLVAESLRYLSMLANNEGRYQEALRHGDEARVAFASVGDLEGEAMALAQRASTLYNLGRMGEARASLEQAVPIFRRSGHRYRVALASGNIGTIALAQGHLADARRWCTETMTVMRDLSDREGLANALIILGEVATLVGEWDVAEAHLREALEISRDVESRTSETYASSKWAVLHLDRGDPAAALRLAQQAVAAGELAAADMERGNAYLTLGYAELATAAGPSALTRAQSAFADAEQAFDAVGSAVLARESRVGRAGAASAAGEVTRSVALVEPVLDHLDRAGLEGAARPAALLLACWEVLGAAGDSRAVDVLARGQAWLREAAARAGDPGMARGALATPVSARLLQAGSSSGRGARPAAHARAQD